MRSSEEVSTEAFDEGTDGRFQPEGHEIGVRRFDEGSELTDVVGFLGQVDATR